MKLVVTGGILVLMAGMGIFLVSRKTNTTTALVQTDSVLATQTQDANTFTLAQIAQHASAADCWMAIDGTVYDVTDYVPQHPGGSHEMIEGCGKDATEMYNARPTENYTDHPPKADALLTQYKVGTLVN